MKGNARVHTRTSATTRKTARASIKNAAAKNSSQKDALSFQTNELLVNMATLTILGSKSKLVLTFIVKSWRGKSKSLSPRKSLIFSGHQVLKSGHIKWISSSNISMARLNSLRPKAIILEIFPHGPSNGGYSRINILGTQTINFV